MKRTTGWVTALGIGCVIASTAASAVESAEQQAGANVETVQAQWQEPRQLNFHYMGFTTYYDCDAIEDRVESIMKQLGAKPDVRVSATGCFAPNRVSNMITARIRVTMPAAVGADAKGAASADHQPFAAQRKTVSLQTNEGGRAGAGDCELLEQLRDQVLPMLKLQVTKDDLHCVPGQAMVGNRVLQVTALVPVKPAGK